ncbi:UNVERIFIED_ORG: hypothetical protein ABIB13_002537 [Arthrobacter sp. UYEF2]
MNEQQFKTTLDPDLYFKGLARQELDFHAALGELVDNALSARTISIGGLPENMTVEITIEQLSPGLVRVQVADHGIGIPLDDVMTRVFNLGGQGSVHGALNEHGFGLKNALALLTGGNNTDFTVLTRSEGDGIGEDTFLRIDGPLSTSMTVRTDASRADWAEGLTVLPRAKTGTKVRVDVSWQYFRTLFRRGNPGLDVLVTRLGEHLGVMQRYYLQKGSHIRVAYRGMDGDWVYKKVQPIPIPFEGESVTVKRRIDVNGVQHEFAYERGTLDYSVKDPDAEGERGWPYPLRHYYQGSNARCGIDIVVRDRVVKSSVFQEIWPDVPKTVDFNRFVGELRVGSDFRTTNNKTGLDPHAENWEQLLQRLAEEEFRPEKATRSDSEKSLRDRLVHILRGTFGDATVTPERKVWGGVLAIDIYVDGGDTNRRVYELKITPGRVLDLYQLLAGWDGLVKDGIVPSHGILVVKEYNQQLQDAVTEANKRLDSAGNPYLVELRRVDELVPSL